MRYKLPNFYPYDKMYEKLLRCVMDYKKYIAEKIKIEGVSAEEIAGEIGRASCRERVSDNV